MKETGSEESMVARQLWLPVQAAPIDRTPAGVALVGGAGVEASWAWLIPLAAKAVSSFF